MRENKLILLSQSFIGTGFFFLYVHHVRSIFETRTNIAHSDQLERESMIRDEDALYYSFYKTLTEERDFWTGFEKLKNVTNIEYPNSVNVLQRFHILPELVIGYFYHLWRYFSKNAHIPLLSCWGSQDMRLPMELRGCDMSGQAMQFYLEIVWLLGGLTVLIIFSYGILLSHNIFGGIYAVISYAMFHSCYMSKIYVRPVARENFAFPFILMQMFLVCLHMDKVGRKNQHISRIYFILYQTFISLIALLCWQFSSVIYAIQILIMLTPPTFNMKLSTMLSTLTTDYAISQLMANALAYFCSFGNKKYAFSWQMGPAFGLLCVSLARNSNHETSPDHIEVPSLKTIALGMLIGTSTQGVIADLLDKAGLTRSIDNMYTLYRDIVVHWALQVKINFTTSLAACNPAYDHMIWSDLWELVKMLIVKPYCFYGVVMLTKFFRKLRKKNENNLPSEEYRERMKKYVLEDFMEDHHISMSDMKNKETEEELNECLKLLAECNYDYEKYKAKKTKRSDDKEDEHLEFMNNIRSLKEKINAQNKKKKKKQNNENLKKEETTTATEEVKGKETDDTEEVKKKDTDDTETQPSTSKSESSNANKETQSKNSSTTANASTSGNTSSFKITGVDVDMIYYAYSFMQLIVFSFIGLCIKKLFFVCFTLSCVIGPTLCTKLCFRKQRDMFLILSLIVFLPSIANPGLVNIREEYYPTQNPHQSDDLNTMLHWIKINTERDAVFAGPTNIIGTVHLTTKRPIVNHAHLEMRQISERTEYVYSVYSRQQSSDIYNQCSQLKIQYLIISLNDCTNEVKNECNLLSIWDDMQPAYRKYPQFCADLVNRNIPSFLKVFSNDNYGIIKLFSQSVQINLKRNKMPEKSI